MSTPIHVEVFDYTGTKITEVDAKHLPDAVYYWQHVRPGTPFEQKHGDVTYYGCQVSATGAAIPETATHAEITYGPLEVQFAVKDAPAKTVSTTVKGPPHVR